MFVVDFLRLNYFAILEARWSEIILPDVTIHLAEDVASNSQNPCGIIGVGKFEWKVLLRRVVIDRIHQLHRGFGDQ
jgi:hypothetical protein